MSVFVTESSLSTPCVRKNMGAAICSSIVLWAENFKHNRLGLKDCNIWSMRSQLSPPSICTQWAPRCPCQLQRKRYPCVGWEVRLLSLQILSLMTDTLSRSPCTSKRCVEHSSHRYRVESTEESESLAIPCQMWILH